MERISKACGFLLTVIFIITGLPGLTKCQSIVGLPNLSRVDSTSFELYLKTDSAAVVTVHVSEDTTYAHAFIFLGRTEGIENEVSIKMDGLRNWANYFYRVFIGTELSPIGGAFTTGDPPKK